MGDSTFLSNLVNPQVMADVVNKKLINAIRFAPLAEIDTTLVGRPGDTISLPYFDYIGAASDISESSSISTVSLNASFVSVTVKEIAVGVELSDRAVLAGYGDPVGEAADQIVKAMADKVDIDLLAILASITGDMLYKNGSSTAALAVKDISDALELFGEDIDGSKVLVASPRLYTKIRNTKDWCPASEYAAGALVRGSVGQIFGCDVVVSNRIKHVTPTSENAYIVKPGALRVFLKRDMLLETDRDILRRMNVLTATKHYAGYLYNAANAIKLTCADLA